MFRLHRTALFGCLSLALVLAGCGGGGSDAGISGSTQFAVQDAYRKLINATTGWSVTGTGSDAATYRIDFNLKLAAPAVFPVTGASGAVSEQFTRVVRNGTMLAEGTSRLFFNAGTLALLGTDEGDGTCSLATSNSTLPASATIGASGALASDNELDTCTAAAAITGSSATTWSLEAESGFALFCLNSALRDAAGANAGSGAQCIEIASDGTLGSRARLRVEVPGLTVVARNY